MNVLALVSGLLVASSISQPQSNRPVLKAAPLAKNDVVALVAPASPLDEALVKRAVEYLRKTGYRVKLSLGYREARGYLAATDERRAAELNAIFANPDVKAILCLRGGYGSPRILDKIDYDLIRRNPKIFVGYSDITALLNAIQARTGLAVFHGLMAKDLSSPGGPTPFSSKYFWSAFQPESRLFDDWGALASKASLRTLVRGRAEGVLVGGNLSVLTSTIGTPYAVNCQGAILFLEEVNEKVFRVDRMLNQLRLSGSLSRLRGVLLGQFTGGASAPRGRTLETVFEEYFGGLGVPVLAGYPAGHTTDQATLPLGIRVRLDATSKTLSLLESAVSGSAVSRKK